MKQQSTRSSKCKTPRFEKALWPGRPEYRGQSQETESESQADARMLGFGSPGKELQRNGGIQAKEGHTRRLEKALRFV